MGKTLEWGLKSVDVSGASAAWGARMILKNGVVDILHDRTDRFSDGESWGEFASWLNNKILPWVQKQAKVMLGDEDLEHGMDKGKFHVRCNTNASHGYLYVTAWMD